MGLYIPADHVACGFCENAYPYRGNLPGAQELPEEDAGRSTRRRLEERRPPEAGHTELRPGRAVPQVLLQGLLSTVAN